MKKISPIVFILLLSHSTLAISQVPVCRHKDKEIAEGTYITLKGGQVKFCVNGKWEAKDCMLKEEYFPEHSQTKFSNGEVHICRAGKWMPKNPKPTQKTAPKKIN